MEEVYSRSMNLGKEKNLGNAEEVLDKFKGLTRG